jgi:hypothetical protein
MTTFTLTPPAGIACLNNQENPVYHPKHCTGEILNAKGINLQASGFFCAIDRSIAVDRALKPGACDHVGGAATAFLPGESAALDKPIPLRYIPI